MVFKKIHLGTVAYSNDSFELVASTIQSLSATIFPSNIDMSPVQPVSSSMFSSVMRRPEGWRIWESVKALALCHNVTPVYGDEEKPAANSSSPSKSNSPEIETHDKGERVYQASSPDEIALVKW